MLRIYGAFLLTTKCPFKSSKKLLIQNNALCVSSVFQVEKQRKVILSGEYPACMSSVEFFFVPLPRILSPQGSFTTTTQAPALPMLSGTSCWETEKGNEQSVSQFQTFMEIQKEGCEITLWQKGNQIGFGCEFKHILGLPQSIRCSVHRRTQRCAGKTDHHILPQRRACLPADTLRQRLWGHWGTTRLSMCPSLGHTCRGRRGQKRDNGYFGVWEMKVTVHYSTWFDIIF